MNGDLSRLGPAPGDKVACGGDKIFKGVGFFPSAPVHEPIMAAGTPTTNMCDGINKAPIDKAQPRH